MKKVIVQLVVFAILFRPEVTSIPQYIIMAKLQVIRHLLAADTAGHGYVFGVFLLMQFMEAIPNEINRILPHRRGEGGHPVFPPDSAHGQARLADGGDFHLYQRVEHQRGAFIYSESRKMLPAMLSQLSGAGVARAGVASAVAVLLLIPPVVIFLFSQKSVVETMAHSGLKG